ncbi:MAG: SDR family NAD(P)-dependent oxidoreductase, partial [Sphingomonadaceae bacterium]|nr:SDR family NAD(P)-dependent oxidoreductase [Sphingomonadaceae bacterium]
MEPTGAVITGGASGIGLAVARQLGAGGVRLVLADLPGERLDAAVAALVAAGCDASGIACDVSDLDQVE